MNCLTHLQNVNGFNNRLSSNDKVGKAKEIHDDLEIDITAYCKHQLNMHHKKNSNGFNQLFKGGEATAKSIVAHNVHENIGGIQQDGTSLLMFGTLTEQQDHNKSGMHDSGLGRRAVMTLQGDGFRTRIVCAYNPCGNARLNSGTTYQQHKRYLVNIKNDLTCSRQRFHEDLIKLLTKWRNKGDRLIVCMDVNENIYKKSIGRALTDKEGLCMVEVVSEFIGQKIGPTFFRGSSPIVGIWATADLNVTHACVMPTG